MYVSKRKANSGKMTILVSGLRKCSKLHFHWRRYDIIILNNKIGGQKLGIPNSFARLTVGD